MATFAKNSQIVWSGVTGVTFHAATGHNYVILKFAHADINVVSSLNVVTATSL